MIYGAYCRVLVDEQTGAVELQQYDGAGREDGFPRKVKTDALGNLFFSLADADYWVKLEHHDVLNQTKVFLAAFNPWLKGMGDESG